jgi:hypothetical protein
MRFCFFKASRAVEQSSTFNDCSGCNGAMQIYGPDLLRGRADPSVGRVPDYGKSIVVVADRTTEIGVKSTRPEFGRSQAEENILKSRCFRPPIPACTEFHIAGENPVIGVDVAGLFGAGDNLDVGLDADGLDADGFELTLERAICDFCDISIAGMGVILA